MRGKVFFLHDISRSVGITPAYAGKSSLLATRLSLLRDHPRLCGEKSYLESGFGL